MPAVGRDQRLAESAACGDQCAICFRPQRSEGNNFEIAPGQTNTALQNFGSLLTTTSKVGRRCWTPGIVACEDSLRCEASKPHRRFPTAALRLRRAFLLSVS